MDASRGFTVKPAASAMVFPRRGSKPRITVTANVLVPLDVLKERLQPWNVELIRTCVWGHCFTIHVVDDDDSAQTRNEKINLVRRTINETFAVRGWIRGTE